MAAPHGPEVDTRGMVLLALGLLAGGIVLLSLPRPLARRATPSFVAGAVGASSMGLYLNGERLGGQPLFNEFFYFWPALFVGYFFTPRGAALTIAGIAACYATVLSQLPVEPAALVPRFTITVASLIGTAVAMRVLREHVDGLVCQLNELARIDGLTNLVNRRAFDERLATELDRARRTGEPFALVLGDVDHFKSINDRLGHAAGDDALRAVAQILTEHSRTIDTVARLGGEEFAFILPGTDLASGVQVAERLRAALKERTELTMSFGVVESPAHGRLPDDLLRTADRALYAAKANGRDRAVTPGDATAQHTA